MPFIEPIPPAKDFPIGKRSETNRNSPGRRGGWAFAAACLLVLVTYAVAAHPGKIELLGGSAAETYYNLMARGFRQGRLAIDRLPPPALAALPDPYDPIANADLRNGAPPFHDLSYFKGRLYLYFGATPALVLFLPYAWATGSFLWHWQAALILCSAGFLAGAFLLRAVQSRLFPQSGSFALACGVAGFGLATGLPLLLSRAEVYEVAIAAGFLFSELALGALYCAIARPERRFLWLAIAGGSYGFAVVARPTLLFGAVAILVPLLAGAASGSAPPASFRRLRLCGAVLLPLAAVGAALMVYNHARFGDSLEFGLRYQLGSARPAAGGHFSWHYLGFNARMYFLQAASLGGHFPFVEPVSGPAPPPGYWAAEDPFGLLTGAPFLILAAFVPLAWRDRRAEGPDLRLLMIAVGILAAANAIVLCSYYFSASRYEAEFAPELGWLAACGMLAADQAWAFSAWRRRLMRSGAIVLLAVSVAFDVCAGAARHAESESDYGLALIHLHRGREAVAVLRRVLALKPDFPEARVNLGDALVQSQQLPEAVSEFKAATDLDPANFEARNNLAEVLTQLGRFDEAVSQYDAAVRLHPGSGPLREHLAYALARGGHAAESLGQYREAAGLEPAGVGVRLTYGLALARAGRMEEAAAQFRDAARLDARSEPAHAYLGTSLAELGRFEAAAAEFRSALALNPNDATTKANLIEALRRLGRYDEAEKL